MFRYAEDGTFYSMIGEKHEVSSGTVIGLIHPLELPEAEKEMWKDATGKLKNCPAIPTN